MNDSLSEIGLAARETIDEVPGDPATTAWKRTARRHQQRWREQHGWPAGKLTSNDLGIPRSRPHGTRIDFQSSAQAWDANFLTASIAEVAQRRLDHAEAFETITEGRLRGDLLSSMPMCFNLFGPLAADPTLAVAVAHRWFPDLCPREAKVELKFEWSPGRRDPRWLNDRTAFDVAFDITTGSGRGLVGVETKYHEHPIATPTRVRNEFDTRPMSPRYRAVTECAGIFSDPAWASKVLGRRVEQIWRDHILALACAQEGTYSQVRSVLVAPTANPSWRALSEEYLALSPEIAKTFEYRTIEALLESAEDLLPHTEVFRARYLDVALDPEVRPQEPEMRR